MVKTIDRNGGTAKVYPALIKDMEHVYDLLNKSIGILALGNPAKVLNMYKQGIPGGVCIEALQELLRMATHGATLDYDIALTKEIVDNFMRVDGKKEPIRISEDKYLNFIVENRKEDVTVKTMNITGRNGQTYTTYTYLLSDFRSSLELLQKVDTISTTNNMLNTESEEALLEILYRAFNRKVDKDTIVQAIDADDAIRVVRHYFDLPVYEPEVSPVVTESEPVEMTSVETA